MCATALPGAGEGGLKLPAAAATHCPQKKTIIKSGTDAWHNLEIKAAYLQKIITLLH